MREIAMSLLDTIMGKVNDVAAKVGVTPDQVQQLTATLQNKLGDGTDQLAAIEQTAREHGVPVEKIQALMAHAGEAESLASQIGGLAKGIFNKN
jgi:hypothetical protein